MKKREPLKPGYKAFNGYIFNQSDCDRYNRIQDRINAFLNAGLPVPKIELNDSNITFKLIIGVL